MTYSLTWNLDRIFPGGSHSPQFLDRMRVLAEQIQAFQEQVNHWQADQATAQEIHDILVLQEKISDGFGQCMSFVQALLSQNTMDTQAKTLMGDLIAHMPAFQLAKAVFTKKFTTITDKDWQALLQHTLLQSVAFRLNEMRTAGQNLLSEKEEHIINTLSLDGLHAWSQHYDTIVASINIPFQETDGTMSLLSAGQAFNRMMSDPDAEVRARLFATWESTWQEKASLLSDTLNHLDGFRLSTYALHHIDDFLEKPLQYNRMKKETLQTMWQTITKNKAHFTAYLNRKAALLGKEKLDWQDQDAPVILGNLPKQTFTFDEAAAFIIRHFQTFSPKMAAFSQKAFEQQWIEAEDRPNKRPGGYCTSLPETKESRIFMTFSNSINEVATLAHELGHAFHSSVMWGLPSVNREYAMNVAETASTFAELIVADATLQEAKTAEEKIYLLDVKLQNAIAMFMNIHARFIFETNFYTARQQGLVAEQKITELMLNAQKEAYQKSLGSYHPHFWASKLHFFIDDVPFYNFPYTFGYLFSMGIYAHAQQQSNGFEAQYIALLQDTASMTAEELAQKHLHVDLTQEAFWQSGIEQIMKDCEEFMRLTEAYI